MDALRIAAEQADPVELGPVEREVLSRLHRGLSNGAICDEMGIDPDGLKAITCAVLERLGARSREQLVVLSESLIKDRSGVA